MPHPVTKHVADKLLDAIPAHIAILNSQGEIVEVNSSWKEFARENDCSDEQFYVGTNYLHVCEHALEREFDATIDQALNGIRAILRGEQDAFVMEYPCNSPATERWFALRARSLEFENEPYVVVLHENISEHKFKQREYVQAARYFRELYENNVDAIMLTTPDGTIVSANPAACNMFGRSEDEIRAAGRTSLMNSSDPRLAEALMKRGQTGKFRGELIAVHKDGTNFPIDLSSSVFSTDGNIYTIVIARDMTKQKKFELELQASRDLFRRVAEDLPDTLYTLDLEERRVTYFNRNSFLGYGREELMAPGSLQKKIHPDDSAAVAAYWQKAIAGEKPPSLEYRIQNKAGLWEWIESRKIVLSTNPNGTPKEIMVVLRVITAKKEAEDQIAYHARLLESVNDVIIGTDINFLITYWNAAAQRIFGWETKEVLGREVGTVLRTAFIEGDLENSIREINEKGTWRGEVIQYTKDGKPMNIDANIIMIRNQSGEVTGFVSANRDITERKDAEEKLRRAYQIIAEKNLKLEKSLEHEYQLARTDGLTGAKNYRYFSELAAHEIAKANRYHHSLSIIMFDIDRFKEVNDAYGHLFGDEVLKLVAELAQQRLRKTDVLARYGGEEFVILLPNTTAEDAFTVAEDIRKHVGAAVLDHNQRSVSVTISLGIADTLPDENNSIERLTRLADKALYAAKVTGRDRTMIYSAEMDT